MFKRPMPKRHSSCSGLNGSGIRDKGRRASVSIRSAQWRLVVDQKKESRRSITDELTSLFNRTYSRFKLEEEARRAQQSSLDLPLILFSVDDFGQFSDEIGNCLLQGIGKLLQRPEPVCTAAAGPQLPGGARHGRHRFTDAEGLPLKRVTVCCGVASKAEGADVMVKRAEDALERARLFGPGRTGLDTGRSAA